MISSEDYVTNNDDDLISGFDKSICSGDSVCELFENE